MHSYDLILTLAAGFGAALTVVLVRVLADNNDLHTQAGHIAVGWLVVPPARWRRHGVHRRR